MLMPMKNVREMRMAAADRHVLETDGRLLTVRAPFSWGWNLVDFLMYLIGYLQINQLIMAFRGIESGLLNSSESDAPPPQTLGKERQNPCEDGS
ncbi:hypothetical protein M2153_002456 [Pseudomonas sp. JUb96]|nr:hypothetical protein [Pseudomonas sp. JUb96]